MIWYDMIYHYVQDNMYIDIYICIIMYRLYTMYSIMYMHIIWNVIDVYSTYACPPNNKHRPSRPVTIESVQQKGSPGQSDSSWQGLMIQVFNSGAQRLCRSVICFLLNFPTVGPAWWLPQLWKRTVYMSSDEDHAIPCW